MTLLRKLIKITALTLAVIVGVILLVDTDEDTEKNQPQKTAIAPVAILSVDKITLLKKEALRGDPDAQYNLAYLYENGIGVEKDEAKALELYRQAANQGHPLAQDSLEAKSPSKKVEP